MSTSTTARPFAEVALNLEQSGKVDELIRLHELRAREVPRPEEAGLLLARAGTLAKDRLKDADRAVELYRRALAYAPSERESLKALAELLATRSDAAAVVSVLERLGQASSGLEAASHFARAAEVCEAKLHRKDRVVFFLQLAARAAPKERVYFQKVRKLLFAEGRAQATFDSLEKEREVFGDRDLIEDYADLAEQLVNDPAEHALAEKALARVLAFDPQHPRALAVKKALASIATDWKDRVKKLEARAMEESNRKDAARAMLAVARLQLAYGPGEAARVSHALNRCLALWPAMPQALELIERQGTPEEQLAALQAQLGTTTDPAAKVELHLRIGQLLLAKLSKPAEAAATFEAAARLDPSRVEAVELASEALVDAGRAEDALALLEKHLESQSDRSRQLSLRLHLSELAARGLKDPKRALVHLEAAHQVDPHNPGVSWQLARRLADDGNLEAAWPLLEVAASAPRPTTDKVTFCEYVALMCEEAQDPKRAWQALAVALPLAPGRASLLKGCAEAAEKAAAQGELASLLSRVEGFADASALPALHRLLGLTLVKLNRLTEARAPLDAAQKAFPEDAEVKEALQTAKRRTTGEMEDPRGHLEQKARALEAAAAPAAELFAVYTKQLAYEPNDAAVLEKLARVAEKLSKWSEAAAAFERLVALAHAPEARRTFRHALASLYAERLERADEAAALLLALVAEGDDSAEVLSLLERLTQSGVRKAEVARALAPVYGKKGDHQRQVASLLVQLGSATDQAQKLELLLLLAEVSEKKLADVRGAFDFLRQALELAPGNSTAHFEALRLARFVKGQQELATLLVEVSPKVEPVELATSMLRDAAELAEEAKAIDDAVVAYTTALARAPKNRDLLKGLAALLVRAKRDAERELVLKQLCEVVDAQEKEPAYRALAALQEQLGRFASAAESWQKALDAGGPAADLLERKAQALERAGKGGEQTEVLAKLVTALEAKGDGAQAANVKALLGKLQAQAKSQQMEALAKHVHALAKDPNDATALMALENALGDAQLKLEAARALAVAGAAASDARRQVAALMVVADVSKDTGEQIGALKSLGALQAEALRQPEQAFAAYARAVALAPSDEPVRRLARTAAEQADALDSFVEVLEELLPKAGASTNALHQELAEIYEKNLVDHVAAVKHLEAVLAAEPKNDEALGSLQRLHRSQQAWAGLFDITVRRAELERDDDAWAALIREAATVAEQHLDDEERAAKLWKQLATRDPQAKDAAVALERLATALDKPDDLGFALELRRGQGEKGAAAVELAFRLAQVREKRLADPSGAVELYRQVLEADPEHAGALEAVTGLIEQDGPAAGRALEIADAALAQAGDHQGRLGLLQKRLARAQGQEERFALSAQVRALLERDLHQPEAAFMHALKAFTDGVGREAIQADLERLAKLTGSFGELAEIYESTAEELDAKDPDAVALFRRAAELHEHENDADAAVKAWQALTERAPKDAEGLAHLAKLLERTQSAKNLCEVYAKQAALAADPQEKFELLLKAADAWEESGDDQKAIESLEAAKGIEVTTEGLTALLRLYAKTDRAKDEAQTLATLADTARDAEAKKSFLSRRAALLEKTGQKEAALKAFVAVLELSKTDGAALAGLTRLLEVPHLTGDVVKVLEGAYRAAGDVRRLVEVLEVKAEAAAPDRRLPVLLEIASIREATGQKAQALAVRLRTLNEAPDDVEVREEMERLVTHLGAWEELSAAYEDLLEKGQKEPTAGSLWKRLASVAVERLERSDLAIRACKEVLQRDPSDLETLRLLARTYQRTSQFAELVEVMKRQLALEKSQEAQVNLLYELAGVAEDALSDKALAAQCYASLLERTPDDLNAVRYQGRLLADLEKWPELAQLLSKELALVSARGEDEVALELMVRLGRLKLTRLNDAHGALTSYQQVLQRRQRHAGAVGALEEMASGDNPLKGEAARTLEPVFENEGDHLKQVQMLEARVGAEQQPLERAALLRKITELYAGELANVEMAFVTAARALREVPDDPKSLELMLDAASKADVVDEAIALLVEVAPRASDEKARVHLFRALARLQTQNDEADASVESWKRVMELAPTDAEAMEQVGRLLATGGRVGELLDVLKRQLTVEEDTNRRVGLLFQIGSVQEDQAKDLPGALASFRRVLELKPDDASTLAKVDRLCEQQQRWPEVADVVARRLKLAAPEEKLELTFRLAQVKEAKVLDKAGAVDLYAEILQANPVHAGALQRLEALVQREPQNQAATQALLTAYRTSGDHEKLPTLIEARVKVSPDSLERKGLFFDLAKLRENQGEPELAFLALYKAFKEDPNDASLRAHLEKEAAQAGSWDELIGAYEGELGRIAEPADVAQVCITLGQVYEQHQDEPDEAVTYYEKARATHPDSGLKVLPALDRLYGQLGDLEKQAAVLDALAPLQAEAPDKVALFFRLGQLAMEKLDSPDRAASAFEKVLAVEPKHLPSLRSLEQLYEQAKMYEKLYRVLEVQRDLVQGAERDRVLQRMATVSAEGGIGDLDHSISLYRELLHKNPRNEQAFDALSSLLDKAGRAEELRELLQARLSVTVDPRELVKLNERLGRVLSERLDRPDDAIPFFKAALERDARHKGALEALRDLYDRLGRTDDLVIVLRRLIPLQEEAQGVKRIRLRLAEVLAQAGRREETLDAARRVLEAEPHQLEELDRVYSVFAHLKAWADGVRAYEAKAAAYQQAGDVAAAVDALFGVADIWRGVAQKPEAAGPVLLKILEIDGSNRKAYEQAIDLYTRLFDWKGYAQVMEHFLPHLVTDEEKVATLRELAKVQEQKLNQKDVAFLSYCRALPLMPQDDALREEIERLADETGSHEELAAVYEEVADNVPRGPLAERMYLTLARVYDQKLDDPDAAEKELRKILDFDPTNGTALERLAKMFARRGQNKEYVVSLEQKLEATASLEARKEILREIARVWSETLNDPREAESALSRALELEPDLDTLSVLAALQKKAGNFTAVASTLLRMRDVAPTPEERARLQVEVAVVYERELLDDEAAIEGYRQALEFDPANVAALESLERLYSKLDRPAELLSVYERQLELASDFRERVRILFKSASIWEERFQNLANADACISAALEVDPQSLQAIKALERLRKTQGRWDELIGVVDRHIQLLTNPEEKADLCVELGDIFHQQLKAVDRAVTTYHQALEMNPKCRPAMHALGMLYERSGNWPFALDMLEREAQVSGSTPEAVELWFRMGKINEDMLIDPGSAKRGYHEALRIDPGYLPAIRALKGLYEIERDFDSYEKALIEEAKQTEDPVEKARAFLEVARYYDGKENRDEAAKHYEESIRLVPDSLEAAKPLADIYLSRENWAGCEQMLDIVTTQMSRQYAEKPDEPDLAKELCRRFYRLGYVCEKLSKRDKAINAYEKAYQLDSTYLAVLEGYGHLLVEVNRWEEAQRVYQSILVHHRGDLTDLEVAEIYWTLGDLHFQQKQLDKAENHFEKALAIDPQHEGSLRSMVSLCEQTQAWDKVADYRQKLLQIATGDERFECGVALGKLAREKLSDPYVAIDAYLTALKEKPEAVEVLDALYVIYRETKQGAKAAETLEKMLATPALTGDPQRAKRVWFALGEIARDELADLDKAVGAFNAALDLDWHFIEAFSSLEAMLGRNKKWKTLDDNYKRMLARLPKTDETHGARMTLWKALGDLYLNVMKAPDAAVEVYKVVAQGLPDNVEVQEQFAALAQTQAGHEQQAIDAWRRALPMTTTPGRVASALAELAAKRKDYDSAWLAAQVASGLIGEVGQGDKEILTKLSPYAKKREVAQRQLTDRLWQQHLYHPKVRGPLGELLAILFEQVGALYKEDPARYGVNPKKHLIDVATAQEYQIHHFRYVTRLFGMEQVALFSPFLATKRELAAKKSAEPAPDPMVGVEILHTDPVALKVGGRFFGEAGQKEAYYLLGRTLALLRPELMLTARLTAERLEAVLQAAISFAVDRFRFTADLRAIDTERKLLERSLTEQARGALVRVAREYVKVATPNDLRNYIEGAELSATRAGAFVAGDIEPVKKMVMAETGSVFRVQPRSKIRDLMGFALGEDLHALRVAVGINVEVAVRK